MSSPPPFRSELWRHLAHAQEVALADERPLDDVTRSVVARIAARSGPVRNGGQVLNGGGWRRGSWRVALRLGAPVAVVAIVALFALSTFFRHPKLAPMKRTLSLSGSLSGGQTAAEGAFVADARSDLPLQFNDGSAVVFRAGSAGRVQRLTGAGAEVILERGWLEAHVIHADTTLWMIHAGPYRVRVTGTRFAMTWAAATFEVLLYEGSVVVDGAVLGAGVPLRAGQRLKIEAGVVLVEPLGAGAGAPRPPLVAKGPVALRAASAASDVSTARPPLGSATAVSPGTSAPPVEGATPDLAPPRRSDVAGLNVPLAAGGAVARERESRGGGSRARGATQRRLAVSTYSAGTTAGDEWLTLAERGEYRQALAMAERVGWSQLCRRLDARRLLTLGDVARYSGAQNRARQAFEALVTRFPDDALTADAVFSLGRLAFETRHPAEATRWFVRYVSHWPDAPLADQAAGRVLECAIRLEDRAAARTAASRYLARAPDGPHATLAREILDQPANGLP